jgi:ABC-type uncharacterized transport system substrate-binding protein
MQALRLILKRLSLGLLLIAAAAGILLYSDSGQRVRDSGDLPQIAILQFASRPLLDDNVQGVIDGLAGAGFVDGKTISIRRFNAQNDMPTMNAIAREMADGRYKLIMTSSTPCLQAVANANKSGKSIHVFGAVTDPFGAGVGISREDPLDHPKHLVGIGTFQPVERTFELARELFPGLKRVGVVWNPAEACSEACVLKARDKCQELDVELLEATVDQSSGVREAAESLVARGAQALWIGGDNTVEMAIDSLVEAAHGGKIPVFNNSPGIVDHGLLFGLGANYYDVGLLSGELAAEILKGADPAKIPVEDVVPERLAFNKLALSGLRDPWNIPPELLAKADVILGPDGQPEKGVPADRNRARTAAKLGRTWKVFLVRYNDSRPAETATKGVEEGLDQARLVEGRDYTLTVQSAQGDIATLNTILAAVESEGADMVLVLSTPTLQAAVHRFVADAVVAGAATSKTDHQANVTGITTLADFAGMPPILRACLPSVRRVGTLFTPSEANSVFEKDMLARHLAAAGIELVDVPVSSSAEVTDSALSLSSRNIDAVCQCLDNLTAASFPNIANVAERHRLPVFGFASSQAKEGALIVMTHDYYDGGVEAGLLAARVMRGEDPAGIPITNLTKSRLIVNLRQARKLGVKIPESLLRRADEVIQ